VALGKKRSLGFRGSGSARDRPDRCGQPYEIQPLALECIGGSPEPFLRGARRRQLERLFYESRMVAVDAAQKVHRIGDVAVGVRTGGVDQAGEMPVPGAAVVTDARQMALGRVERLAFDEPVSRHSRPSLRPGYEDGSMGRA